MRWMTRVLIPCAFLALLGCGADKQRAEPVTVTGTGPVPEAGPGEDGRPGTVPSPVPDSVPAADPEPAGGWPAIDDDPSLDSADGSGDWCGTGMSSPGRLQGAGISVRLKDGKVIGMDVRDTAWKRPRADGVWRRWQRNSMTSADVARLEEAYRKTLEEVRALGDPKEPKAWRRLSAELERLDAALRSAEKGGWTQFGIEREGVFHVSKPVETLEAFRARLDRELGAAKEAPKQDAPAKKSPPAKKDAAK